MVIEKNVGMPVSSFKDRLNVPLRTFVCARYCYQNSIYLKSKIWMQKNNEVVHCISWTISFKKKTNKKKRTFVNLIRHIWTVRTCGCRCVTWLPIDEAFAWEYWTKTKFKKKKKKTKKWIILIVMRVKAIVK